jgi:hypothetical protein
MLGDMVLPVQPCCYGFIEVNPAPAAPGKGTWSTTVQRVFRPQSLWLWGELIPDRPHAAVLTSLELCGKEQLINPWRFVDHIASLPIDLFLKLVQHAPPWNGLGVLQLEGNWVRPELKGERLTFPALAVGQTIHFGFHGLVRGVVLVGEQVQ